MNSKIVLLSVAVVAVGLFALPTTVSLFAGQHTWYDPKELSCFKCHQDVQDEIKTGNPNKVHNEPWAQACEGCHKTPSANISGNSTLNGGTLPFFYSANIGANRTKQGFHGATTLECVTCHVGVAVEAYSPANFVTTTAEWSANSLGSPQEAHTAFALQSTSTRVLYNDNGTIKSSSGNQSVVMLKGANTACVGCHTHIWVNATWKRNSGYGFTADESSGSYVVSFWLNSTVVQTSVAANQGT